MPPTDHRLRVLHVTEAPAAGVLSSVVSLCHALVAAGCEVSVAHTTRPDSPSDAQLTAMLPGVRRVVFPYDRHGPLAVVGLARNLRRLVAELRPDVVHLHSTAAGLAGRLFPSLPGQTKLFYTPHGFSFLRQDLPLVARTGLRVLEAVLARTGDGLILVSESERDVARAQLRAPRTSVVPNSIDALRLPRRVPRHASRPTVVTAARIVYPKAPWRFAALARRFGDVADFIWIGDGPLEDQRRWLADAPVTVTGWLDSHNVHARLLDADLFVLPSLWEGLPIALLEAQAIGLAAVATRVVGSRDVIEHGTTGLLVDDEDEFHAAVGRLIGDPERREQLGARAAVSVRARFSSEGLASTCMAAYGRYEPGGRTAPGSPDQGSGR